MTPARFYELAALIPEGWNWGSPLTPQLLEDILAAAAARPPIGFVDDELPNWPGISTVNFYRQPAPNASQPLWSLPPALVSCCGLNVHGEAGYSFIVNKDSTIHNLSRGRYQLFAQALNSKEGVIGENKLETKPAQSEDLTDNCGSK